MVYSFINSKLCNSEYKYNDYIINKDKSNNNYMFPINIDGCNYNDIFSKLINEINLDNSLSVAPSNVFSPVEPPKW